MTDLQTQLREVLRENELLRRDVRIFFYNQDIFFVSSQLLMSCSMIPQLEAKESKLSSSMNSIKTFWSPELKKERALRKDEGTKITVWKEQYRVVQDENQVRPNRLVYCQ